MKTGCLVVITLNSVSVYFKFDKNLYVTDFLWKLLSDSKPKQVKATEVYLLWIFSKNYQAFGNQHRRETVKQIFLTRHIRFARVVIAHLSKYWCVWACVNMIACYSLTVL